MSTRLADRQIRAAALRAAPTLDVRGPVSEALGRAGITVPPEPAPPEEAAPPRPARLEKTLGGVAVPEPVIKPFETAPWPTRAGRTDDPDRALSGLTADERRVHRILLDSLEREAAQSGAGGLTYLERKRLEALDLAFINAQLAKMSRTGGISWTTSRWTLPFLVVLGTIAAAAAIGEMGITTALIVTMPLIALFFRFVQTEGPRPRRQIYEALRELALLVDDAPVSAALDEADRLIDAFAAPAPPVGTVAPPRRVRT